jgi:tetratricopeptide (TPR) repeat protein
MHGSPSSGKVVEMSTTEVKLETRGKVNNFAVNEIRRIHYAEDMPELRRAREDAGSGQFEQALDALKRIDAAGLSRDLLIADVEYYTALCHGRIALTGGGDKAAAAATMLEFVKKNPNSYHFFEAAQLLGDLAMTLENYDNALRYYGAIAKAPWPDYAQRAALFEAGAMAAAGKSAEAKARYESVVASPLDTPESIRNKTFAAIGLAVCQAEAGAPDQGIASLNEVIAKNDPQDTELFGTAYNALGRCQLKANRPKEALLAYLHTDLLFYAKPDLHAEALYNLSKLWTTLNKSDRAQNARNTLVERYAGSVWAKKN